MQDVTQAIFTAQTLSVLKYKAFQRAAKPLKDLVFNNILSRVKHASSIEEHFGLNPYLFLLWILDLNVYCYHLWKIKLDLRAKVLSHRLMDK